jgi:hypothetical protein
MDDFNLDDENELDALKEKQSRGELMKGVMSGMGGMLQAQADVPSAYEYLYKKVGNPTDFKGTFDKMADSVGDPMDKASKAQAYLKMKREGRAGERAESQATAASDAGSPDSLAMQEQIAGIFPQFAPYVKGKSAAQIREMMPILTQKARGDEDRALREQEMRMRAGDRAETRADRKLKEEEAKNNRELKQKELSAAQAKQRGLYEMGKKSEEQFSTATADPKKYDPAGVGQWIDNSSWAPNWLKNDKAVEAQSAQSSWIESFLRDASGAAIPHAERASYAEIYFPQPGDTDDVKKNKAALRAQKMDSARIAAGVETGHGPGAPTAQAAGNPPAKAPASPQDEKALAWAVKNISNPKAQAILEANGIDPKTYVGAR